MTDNRTGRYTHTFLGRRFYATNPRASDIDVRDIAHALSMTNRFNGHTPNGPYSVAQHSVYVSLECDPQDALYGLLHDASEAYICDLPSPVKAQIPQYQAIEAGLMNVICEKFRLPLEMPLSVKVADVTVLAAECRDLWPLPMKEWNLNHKPVKRTIKAMSWRTAEKLFLRRFKELTEEEPFYHIPTKYFL